MFSARFFYLPPDNPVVAPILASLKERRLVEDWPLGAVEALPRLGQDLATALSGDGAMAEVVTEYQRLFIGPDALEAPPWGSVYLEEEGTLFGDTTLALRHFLEAQGVVLNTGVHEPEDHIGLLLWAAAWLAEQEKKMALWELLEKHMFSWSGKYLGRLEEVARHPFYKGLVGLTAVTLREVRAMSRRGPSCDPFL